MARHPFHRKRNPARNETMEEPPVFMRWFVSREIPSFTSVLLVESGSRHLVENLLPWLQENAPEARVDLLTCFSGAPAGLDASTSSIFRVTDYPRRPARLQLLKQLAANEYTICGIVCSGEPILATWKWIVAARLPAKIFVLNENGDLFWLDRGHWASIRHFIAYRAGLTGAGAVRTLARVAVFPFTLLYLLLYAGAVHLRRRIRTL